MENYLHRNSEIFRRNRRCIHAHTDSRLLFQEWSKSVRDKWPKSRVPALIHACMHDRKKQNTFGTLRRNPWDDYPQFSVSVRTLTIHLIISGFIQIRLGLGKL